MQKLFAYAAAACAVVGLGSAWLSAAQGCTGICIRAEDGSIVYARTLEFGIDLDSQVLFLPRDYEFTGTTASGKPGLTWNAKYAAVGLNCFGYKVLADGLNEEGLGAGAFYLPGYAGYQAVTPQTEGDSIAPWEVVTWMLTNFSTVDEVREALPSIKVAAVPATDKLGVLPLHFIAHDQNGQALVIEYVDGQLHTYDNPIGVITNSPTFDWHLTNLRNYINLSPTNAAPVDLHGLSLSQFGQGSGLRGLPGDFTPPSRFVRATVLSQDAHPGATGEDAVATAFHVLDSFDIPRGAVRPEVGSGEPEEYTQWTSAADLKNRKYYFHTYNNRRTRSVDLTAFDIDSREAVTIPLDDSESIEELQPQAGVQ